MAVGVTTATRPRTLDLIAKYRNVPGISDLHFVPDRTAFVRADGDNSERFAAPSLEDVHEFMKLVASPEQLREFNNEGSLTAIRAGYSDEGEGGIGRIRVQVKQHYYGLKVAIRYLQNTPPGVAAIDLPETVTQWMHKPSGLVLFCGITGTGKTTTQASLVHYALSKTNPHVITLENPIEYLYDDDRVTMRELGRHFRTFDQGLFDAMADDPDIIMMGEILNRDTAEAALYAAESGHLVLATVHTNSTMHAADRIVSLFDTGERDMARTVLALQLIGCVGSKLVKKIGGGRRAAFEVLVKTPSVAGAIAKGNTKDIRDALTNTRSVGMQSLEQHLRLLASGPEPQITAAEAKNAAEFPDEVRL